MNGIAAYLLVAASYGSIGYAYWRIEKRRVAAARAEGSNFEARVYKPTQKVCFGFVLVLCLGALMQSFQWGRETSSDGFSPPWAAA
jgi:hypothetical protein